MSGTVAYKILDVIADSPYSVPIVLFDAADLYVYYGKSVVLAQNGLHYSITLGEEFDTFEVEFTAALVEAIDDLIESTPGEANEVTLRRTLALTTEANEQNVNFNEFTADEFVRVHQKLQQLQEAINRALLLPENNVGDEALFTIGGLIDNAVMIYSEEVGGLASGPTLDTFNTVLGQIQTLEEELETASSLADDADEVREIRDALLILKTDVEGLRDEALEAVAQANAIQMYGFKVDADSNLSVTVGNNLVADDYDAYLLLPFANTFSIDNRGHLVINPET